MDDEIVLVVKLSSLATNTSEEKTLKFPSVPSSQEIKQKVEECCSVPTCVQKLYYQSVELADDSSLSSLYLRSNDTLTVTFPEVGECERVRLAVRWLERIIPVLEKLMKFGPQIFSLIQSQYSDVTNHEMAEEIPRKLFLPWTKKTKEVNCYHFISLGGLRLLLDLYHLVIEVRNKMEVESNWKTSRFYLESAYLVTYFESACCHAVKSLEINQTCREEVLRCGGLELCLESFLYKAADDEALLFNHSQTIIYVAMLAICYVAEIPSVQQLLSNRKDVIHQALTVGKSSMYKTSVATLAVILLLNLAQKVEIHGNIFNPEIVDQLLQVCKIRDDYQSSSSEDENVKNEVMGLKYYVAIVLSEVVCGSPHLISNVSPRRLTQVTSLMQTVYSYPVKDIRTYEIDSHLVWETFLPYLIFLYGPKRSMNHSVPYSSPSSVEEICRSACNVLLHCLENAFGRQVHIDVLVKENLLDYVLALPWSVPAESREGARRVCWEVNKLMKHVQPPSLRSLAIVKLAKMKWGLAILRNCESISEIVTVEY